MAYMQDHHSLPSDRDDPNRPIEPKRRAVAEHASSPVSFFALVFIASAVLFAGWLAYNHEFGPVSTAEVRQTTPLKPAPAVGTPVVAPAETMGAGSSSQ